MSAFKQKKIFPVDEVLGRIERAYQDWPRPAVTEISRKRDPFLVLVATLLSLRTKDETTAAAAARLFKLADTAEAMIRLNSRMIEKTIYPVGFYRTKTSSILKICKTLIDQYGGNVPDSMDGLLRLQGVGRKTANLVMTRGFNKPGICVDTHVHRIPNRWGYIRTRSPEQTEMRLRDKLPPQYWIPINDWLVAFGQQICKPVSPLCTECPVSSYCRRVGVTQSR
jgi:endonuclease-3